MRLRSRLTSLTAMAAAVAVLAPMAPANAVPVVTGEYVTFTPTVLRTVVPDECRDVASLKTVVDLQGIGNAIPKDYYDEQGDPLYTNLEWGWKYTINGPNNFYETDALSVVRFPLAEQTAGIKICPSDFSDGKVAPGTYSVAMAFVASNYSYGVDEICSKAEGCQHYPKIYEKAFTTSFTLAGETPPLPPGPTAECLAAKADVTTYTAKVKAAKVAVKKAKASHKKAKIRKAKNRLSNAKSKLNTASGAVEAHC